MQRPLSRAALGRLPMYLRFLYTQKTGTVSASRIARSLGLGEVQVRKDLASVSAAGQPKIGYPLAILVRDIERALGTDLPSAAVIVGTGRLGRALMEYEGFGEYGLCIAAAFDEAPCDPSLSQENRQILPMDQLGPFCKRNGIRIGILSVPAPSAQAAADRMVESGIRAILNFAPFPIRVPSHVTVRQENIALSLAYLTITARGKKQAEEEQYGKKSV